MKNRLPLPTSTIKVIQILIDENNSNLWVKSPLKNALIQICGYDYADAVKTLEILQNEFPSLMDFDKNIKAIKSAEKRYKAID